MEQNMFNRLQIVQFDTPGQGHATYFEKEPCPVEL